MLICVRLVRLDSCLSAFNVFFFHLNVFNDFTAFTPVVVATCSYGVNNFPLACNYKP